MGNDSPASRMRPSALQYNWPQSAFKHTKTGHEAIRIVHAVADAQDDNIGGEARDNGT